MSRKVKYQYYVEGESEKQIINVLKRDLQCVEPGRVEKFNVVQEEFTIGRIRTLNQGTIVVLVFDTDTQDISCLQKNIDFLSSQKNIVKRVICIPQVKNLEEELVYSCNITKIEELTQSRSQKDFKRDLLACTNLDQRLIKCGFSIKKFWSRNPQNSFSFITNEALYIKEA